MMPQNGSGGKRPPVVFAFSGEGVHSQDSDLSVVRQTSTFARCVEIMAKHSMDLHQIMDNCTGKHKAPESLIVTTVINVCLCEVWKTWGWAPTITLGHSVGELAAIYAAGRWTLDQVLTAAVRIGRLAEKNEGAMLHTKLKETDLDSVLAESNLQLASRNQMLPDGKVHVTLCGSVQDIEKWLTVDTDSKRMQPCHAWHHPLLSKTVDASGKVTQDANSHLDGLVANVSVPSCKFISSVSASEAADIGFDYWVAWFTKPVDFISTVTHVAKACEVKPVVIEIGAHPVLQGMFSVLGPVLTVSSMCRGQASKEWILDERRKMIDVFPDPVLCALSNIQVGNRSLSLVGSFGEQGFASVEYTQLAEQLSIFFPGLKPFDLYRYTSVDALLKKGANGSLRVPASVPAASKTGAAVLGAALTLPPAVLNCDELWSALVGDENAVRKVPGRQHSCGYLGQAAFDAKALALQLGVEKSEVDVIDPQHVLALSLAARCFEDAGETVFNEVKSDPARCGVYIGGWQEPSRTSQKASAYRVVGSSLSAMASRVANKYNFQGPATTVNTACSSGLVAVDAALRDIQRGIIDFALVGGVNILSDEGLTSDLARANFISPSGACHTFSSAADGYARSEGGVMMLFARDDGTRRCRALICGAAVNQNSQRRPLTAVDPAAQERVITSACADAGISPGCLAAVECHGTGTKLGDPVEVSALAATVGSNRLSGVCQLTAAKMRFGHLESAAGSLGLLKTVLMAQRRCIPGDEIKSVNPAVVSAMGDSALKLPTPEETKLQVGAYLGVSSFGFSGNNAHAIVRVVGPERVLPYNTHLGTTKEKHSAPANSSVHGVEKQTQAPVKIAPRPGKEAATDVEAKVWQACESVCGEIKVRNNDESIFELGIDSLGLAEMLLRLEESFGEGCLNVDDIMAAPTVAGICKLLGGGRGGVIGACAVADVEAKVWQACESVCGEIKNRNTDESIFELGVDSLGFAEMILRLEESFGEGCLSVDNIMSAPTVAEICKLLGGSAESGTVKQQAPKAVEPPPQPVAVEPQIFGGQKVTAKGRTTAGSTSWIRTTHIGSLPRGDANTKMSDIIDKQVNAGVDWINDGEWTRENYIADMLSRISNIGQMKECAGNAKCLCDMPVAADMYSVPSFRQRYHGGNGLITLNPSRPARADVACTGPLNYQNADTLYNSLTPFLEVIGDRPRGSCFWSVPSPGTLAVFCEDRYYGDHAKFVRALAEPLRQEYAAVAKSGVVVQVDAPDLAMGRHTRHAHLSDDEWLELLVVLVDCINYAIGEIPASQVRVHVCWGNYAGPHHKDIEAKLIWPQLLRLNARYLSVEGGNSRHVHDWKVLRRYFVEEFIAQDKVLMPGVIDTRAPTIEHPDAIAERLMNYVRILGPGRVVASTDCGFATTAKSAAVTEDIAWMKLAALVEGTKRACQQIIDMGAPAPTSVVYNPTGFRVVVFGDSDAAPEFCENLARCAWSLSVLSADSTPQEGFLHLKYAIDTPVALVALGAKASDLMDLVVEQLAADTSLARRPLTRFTLGCERSGAVALGSFPSSSLDAGAQADRIQSSMQDGMRFDKRVLVPRNMRLAPPKPVTETDVVIIGAGLLGLHAAVQLQRRGFGVAVMEQRALVGGIWSMYANSHSQVNSSEGGYSLKDVLGEPGANRDHSTAREMITDIAKLAKEVEPSIHCGVKVVKVIKVGDGYSVVQQTEDAGTSITNCKGVILAINDRVGVPRMFDWPGQKQFKGVIASGTNDNLADVDFRGKNVIVVGMGAFAIENARTALEHGAEHVTVVVRRHGTVCPKIIDYLNFVKPFDENFQHDTATNIKQMRQWSDLYRKSGATIPECWPEQIKHEGHTISVSDLWFVGHHMNKLCTKVGTVDRFDENGLFLSDGSYIQADVVVPCIGFTRNTTLCSTLTGHSHIKNTNYLDKHMMYLADAEIDHGAFNWFFGSSVLEYAKFFTEVYITGLEHEDEVGELLWGSDLETNHIDERKWSQYIASSDALIKAKHAGIPYFAQAAENQVHRRTVHFNTTLPPTAYVEANEMEWRELHTRLNGGVPVPVEKQLPYFFKDAASWCVAK